MTKPTPPFAILFDMDGVLIDSVPSNFAGRDDVAHLYGFTPAEMQAHSRPGRSLKDFYDTLQKVRPFAASFDEFADTVLENVFRHLQKTVRPDPNTLAFINGLKVRHIPVAVATSALGRSAQRKLELVGLHNIFDQIVTANDVKRHKPHPDVYLEAAKRLRISPAQCVVVEDAEDGILAGKRAGMIVVGFSKYLNDPAVLAQADLVITDFSELNYDKLSELLKTGRR